MKSCSSKWTAMLIILVLAATATSTVKAQASDLATQANIYVYPRPYKCSELVLKNTAGRTVSLSDYRGKVVLLHFWSMQCPACRIEEPLLHALKRAFGPGGLEILGVNLTDPPAAVAAHCSRNNFPFPALVDAGNGFALRPIEMGGKRTAFVVNPAKEAVLEVPGFPTTYIINCKGAIVGYSVGAARWNHKDAVNLIQGLVLQSKTCGVDSPSPLAQASN